MFKSYEFYSIPSKIFHSAQTLNSQSTFWVQNHYCRSGSSSSTSSVDQVLVLENQQCRSGSCSSTSSVDQVLVLKSSVDQVLVLVLVVQKRSGPSTSIVYIRFWYLQCTSGSGSSTSSVDQVLVLVLVVQIRFWFQLYQCISGSCSRTSTVLQTRFWFQYKYYSVDQCISAVRISGSGSRISSAYQVLVLVLLVYIRFWFSYQQCISGFLFSYQQCISGSGSYTSREHPHPYSILVMILESPLRRFDEFLLIRSTCINTSWS